MTTEPDEVPPPSGLEPELADELGPAAVGVDVLEELLLEQAVTAAMPTTARAAMPLLAEILLVIWTSLRTGYSVCLAYTGQPEEAPRSKLEHKREL